MNKELRLAAEFFAAFALIMTAAFFAPEPAGFWLGKAAAAAFNVSVGLLVDWRITPDEPPNIIAIAIFALGAMGAWPG